MRKLALLFVLLAGVAPARATAITTGDIDLSDYNSLASNFAPGGYGAAAVPEPNSFAIAVVAISGIAACFSRC